jgi:TRAP-type C4-dicarboxylate transport system permease small subunit
MALMVAMVAVVTLGVFFRYVLDASLTWYDEFASYLLVWLSFYGAVVVTWRGRHINFETLAERVRPAGRRALAVVSEVLSLVFQAVLLAYGIVLVRAVGHETAVSIETVRMGWVYSALPISGGLMLLVGLVRLGAIVAGHELQAAPGTAAPTVGSE